MSTDEEQFRTMWQEVAPSQNEAEALEKVLSSGAKITAAKDVSSLFVGWVWVLFLGFGASMYSAKRKFDLHNQQKRKHDQRSTQQNKHNNGEQ